MEVTTDRSAAQDTFIPLHECGIWVAGIKVTPDNSSRITGPGIKGNVSFNYQEQTLYLWSAQIEGDYGIYVHLAYPIRIYISGENFIAGEFAAICTASPIEIEGSSLTLWSKKGRAISADGLDLANLKIERAAIRAYAPIYVVGKLQINNSNVNVSLIDYGNTDYIYKAGRLEITNCKVVYPEMTRIIERPSNFYKKSSLIVMPDSTIPKEVCISTISKCVGFVKTYNTRNTNYFK